MAAAQLMNEDPFKPLPPVEPVDIVPPPGPVGTDALGQTGAANELMPVGAETITRDSFETPTQPMPTPQKTGVQEEETVAGQLRQLLSEDSPYMIQAAERGKTLASQRGLQNTTMAIQAAEQGRIAAAAPIAAADARTFSERAQLNQNTVNRFRENEVDHLQELISRAQQGDINAQLQLDQFGFNSSLSAQENFQRMEQMALAGDIDAQQRYLDYSYTALLGQVQQGYAIQLEDQRFQNAQTILSQQFANALGLSAQQSQEAIERLNAQHQNTIAEIGAQAAAAITVDSARLGYQLQAQYLSEVAARQQAASEEIRTILTTEGLSPQQQNSAVRQAQNRMTSDINLLSAYYAFSPQWDDRFGSRPASSSGGSGGSGGTTTPPPPSPPGTSPPISPEDDRFPSPPPGTQFEKPPPSPPPIFPDEALPAPGTQIQKPLPPPPPPPPPGTSPKLMPELEPTLDPRFSLR